MANYPFSYTGLILNGAYANLDGYWGPYEDEADAAIASLLNWPLRKPGGFNSANARCVFMIFSGEVRLQ